MAVSDYYDERTDDERAWEEMTQADVSVVVEGWHSPTNYDDRELTD